MSADRAPMERPLATLVSPRRLGALLREAREKAGLSLEDLTEPAGMTLVELDDVEQGRRLIDDSILQRLVAAYRISAVEFLPMRSELVIDLDQGHLLVQTNSAAIMDEDGPDAILSRYLALVYHLRDLPIGSAVPLRDADLETLSRALQLPEDEVTERLSALMVDEDQIAREQRQIRRRLLWPIVGVIIGACAAGTLILVSKPNTQNPADSAQAALTDDTAVVVANVDEVVTDIGNGGAIEERNGG